MNCRSKIIEKRCPQCDLIKPAEDYSKYTRKCNKCVELYNSSNFEKPVLNIVETERERHREKYHRLGYKEKQIEWNKNKPWKKSSVYKNLRKHFYKDLDRSYELHHWNYNDEYLKDVFILDIKDHKKLHTYLNLDIEKRIFYLEDGTPLDTREKHEALIKELNIQIYN